MRYKSRKIYTWSPDLAYVVGLLTADGCLSKDNRHIDFTSKDYQLVDLYRKLVKPNCYIGTKFSGLRSKLYFRVQISDVALYDFLLSIGLVPNKSKIIGALSIPDHLFADFLRGLFDGDGSVYGVWDNRWKNSYMFYTSFVSASLSFLNWLKINIDGHIPGLKGHIAKNGSIFRLAYAKADTRVLFRFMYHSDNLPYLERKYKRYLEIFALDPYPTRDTGEW